MHVLVVFLQEFFFRSITKPGSFLNKFIQPMKSIQQPHYEVSLLLHHGSTHPPQKLLIFIFYGLLKYKGCYISTMQQGNKRINI